MRKLDHSNTSLLDTLLELQHLDLVPRSGYLLRGVTDPESVSEHSFHIALLVWILGSREEGLDVGKAVAMALIHDAAEVRTGDLPRPISRYLDRDSKKAMEAAVLEDLLAPIEEARDLASDYRAGQSIEARFVAACDRLQLLIKVLHYQETYRGALEEFWERATPGDSGFGTIDRLMQELLTRREMQS